MTSPWYVLLTLVIPAAALIWGWFFVLPQARREAEELRRRFDQPGG